MSEEILKALMQLFAIIAKQDDGSNSRERKYVANFLATQLEEDGVQIYLKLFDEMAEIQLDENQQPITAKPKLTSVKDAVKTLAICKKINKTLSLKQKIIVLVRLYEMLKYSDHLSAQRMEIINIVGEVFNIYERNLQCIEAFVTNNTASEIDFENILSICTSKPISKHSKHISYPNLDGEILVLQIEKNDLYFLRYTGNHEILLNGLLIKQNRIYTFSPSSVIKITNGKPLYYSDIISKFLILDKEIQLSLNADDLSFKFPNGGVGFHKLNISEGGGKLVGIMGASGSGKTTLMNVLSGINEPSTGKVLINGIDIHQNPEEIKGLIGYITQDDLLIEELTVYQNLYYNAKLCFDNLDNESLINKVNDVLESLHLENVAHLKVGNVLNKSISGGQRKRLNIGLELIREPYILFVDEPTSGLSSKDSENVMDLLSQLTLRGKLIFVVIHQPSSVIYRMFDKIIILETGGHLIYYGNPIEAISYFKKIDLQANTSVSEHVNPELIFNIIEAQVVDEFGNFTGKRKFQPDSLAKLFLEHNQPETVEDSPNPLPENSQKPNRFKQFLIFFKRDLVSKLANKQYVIINLLQAPVLAFFLSFIIRYIEDPSSDVYVFRENDNLPAYLLMIIIVALFIGLIVSAEEIFKDRKILKREAFLNLSRGSYLASKVCILFGLSAIQTALLVLIGNSIMGIQDMFLPYWLVLFSLSCLANILGLNISSAFNSPVTIYILIPLLIIPQMILGGAIFSYEKLNKYVGGGYQVPFIAEIMPSRWAYEALTVHQFKNNAYQKKLYEIDRIESKYDFKTSYAIPMLKRLNNECRRSLDGEEGYSQELLEYNFKVLRNEITKELENNSEANFLMKEDLNLEKYDLVTAVSLKIFLENLEDYYKQKYNRLIKKKDSYLAGMHKTKDDVDVYRKLRDNYYNENLAFYLKNRYARNKAYIVNGNILQVIDPIYKIPANTGKFRLKYFFYSPLKYFFKWPFETLYFNVIVIWAMAIILYIMLFFNVLERIVTGRKRVH